MSSIVFNKTITKVIEDVSFGSLSREVLQNLFKDGRIFSHFAEHFLAQDYNLKHITGCKGHDLTDTSDAAIQYEQKTFTGNGCKFMPSNMIGQGRHFDQAVFDEKSKKLIYVIVSNVDFPNLKIRFVKGVDLASKYPTGEIKFSQHDNFFQDSV